nr:hypothetical protein [Maliibacterium massiliense]
MRRVFQKAAAIVLLAACLAGGLAGCARASAVVALDEAARMSGEALSQALAGVRRDRIIEAWGAPVQGLFGMYGDIYTAPDQERMIIVYYDANSSVSEVKVSQMQANAGL